MNRRERRAAKRRNYYQASWYACDNLTRLALHKQRELAYGGLIDLDKRKGR